MTARSVAGYLNALPEADARVALARCCGATRWVDQMVRARPFPDDQAVFAAAEQVWHNLGAEDWREAFAQHPRIGDMGDHGRPRAPAGDDGQAAAAWSREEQRSATSASAEVRTALAEGNRRYEERFGHVFLICATGRSAEEMLAELRRRLPHSPAEELIVAAGEQAKITRLRLEKLVTP